MKATGKKKRGGGVQIDSRRDTREIRRVSENGVLSPAPVKFSLQCCPGVIHALCSVVFPIYFTVLRVVCCLDVEVMQEDLFDEERERVHR